jgi:hypothetical protein
VERRELSDVEDRFRNDRGAAGVVAKRFEKEYLLAVGSRC